MTECQQKKYEYYKSLPDTFCNQGVDYAIKAIARIYKWSPERIGKLFINGNDFLSLKFWYNDAKEYIKEINKSMGALH